MLGEDYSPLRDDDSGFVEPGAKRNAEIDYE
jgi:hypothetical protein